ncbi:DUF3152 domain-containing protein [Streptomyces sp. NPDC058157]|uniref:DUF3152 domain-containing protein n=1 Tax=Streptomyces sp. NPDC058157 TaxID=3346360 RepID=UPI0036EEF13A
MGRHSRKTPAAAPAPSPYGPGPDGLYEPEPYPADPYEARPHTAEPYEPRPHTAEPYGVGPHTADLYESRPHAADPYPAGPYEPQPSRPPGHAPQPSGPRGHQPQQPSRPSGPAPDAPPGYGEPRGRRRSAESTVVHQGYAQPPARPAGHPEQHERGGAWGADASTARYGDWRGAPRAAASATATPDAPAVRDATPAAGFPRITEEPPAPAADAVTSTGSHRRVPGPRTPAAPGADRPSGARGTRVRIYTGVAALAVTAALAVVVAGQVTGEGDPVASGAHAAGDDGTQRAGGDKAASRSDGRPTPASPPPAQPATYEQQMARQLPIDAKLTGSGTFDTVPGVAKAPGKGKVVRYRVDVEQGLGMDPQLFAEAVQRTLNDPRSWAHDGEMTFERVPEGKADFVITLASPGTTGAWCAKSDLDTTIDNVSCDSASTERVMINAFRWGQGSPTYGADQMFAYRQMLINHEVGHRLGHGHVSCTKAGSLAPIMQQQTKSLDIDNIHCLPNPWVYPGN